ncbi:hypothetical protein NW762_011937 [Fusarium torreyae]|uniref:Uncharacterized protein n=1 Tax=Fusarium torreyae TaxID=1237075 RepID=A0A9W8RPS9_9HYPO|nr:hypothetical protein NW762_011937 [Fusarium torreyae]
MRYNAWMLAVGLFAIDSALAGPCKPRSSTSETATAGSEKTTLGTTTTILATSTEVSTDVTQTTSLEATMTTVTAADTTTTTTEAETSTTAAAAGPTPTYIIVAQDGDIDGAVLEGVDQEGTLVLFDSDVPSAMTRNYILESDTGRLKDANSGNYLCAYYGDAPSIYEPATVANCQNGNTGPNKHYDYLNCKTVSGILSCTAPKAYCDIDDFDSQYCMTSPENGVNDQFFYRYSSSGGAYLFISSGTPNAYTTVDLGVTEVSED